MIDAEPCTNFESEPIMAPFGRSLLAALWHFFHLARRRGESSTMAAPPVPGSISVVT